ncbi:MAG: DUF4215 domain-containing protein [Phycisphaerae bacterium]
MHRYGERQELKGRRDGGTEEREKGTKARRHEGTKGNPQSRVPNRQFVIGNPQPSMLQRSRKVVLTAWLGLACALAGSPARGHVILNDPNGGEALEVGSVSTIEWQIQITHSLQNWDLWYSTTGPGGPWIEIAMDMSPGNPAAGSVHSYEWTIPDTPSNQTRVRVRMDNSGADYYDESDGDFTIVPAVPPLPGPCNITFDGTCPNMTPLCGADFVGSGGCIFAMLTNCYSSGLRSFKVTAAMPLTINLSGDLLKLRVFFAGQGLGTGTMTFFDISAVQVDSPISTNGNCLVLPMPQKQLVTFSRAVRKIEVIASGTVWIDDFTVNPDVCGNGTVEAGEQCDDGNLDNGDGCAATCTDECGDGIQDTDPSDAAGYTEECDDSNTVGGDGCDENCISEICGNGVVQTAAGEACDDGNTAGDDGCSSTCTVETGWQCTDNQSVCTEICGDGLTVGSEECDDGDTINGNGCDNNCTVTACGNGIVTAGEECDDGNTVSGDGCDANCVIEFCGDGTVNNSGTEQCDDGNTASGDGCDENCVTEFCGDSIVNDAPNEECDDGNTATGDGCDENCLIEVPSACCTGFPAATCANTFEAACTGTFAEGEDCAMGFVCPECGSDDDCDDGSACTTDVCAAGRCVFRAGVTCGQGEACDSTTGLCQRAINILLEPIATGLCAPVGLTHAGDGSGRLFVVDQCGLIRIIDAGGNLLATPFLDITAKIPVLNSFFDERGLLGLAFHPNYAINGRFFVRYSAPRPDPDPVEPCNDDPPFFFAGCHKEVLAEYAVSMGDPDVADATSEIILFEVDEPQFNHDSGEVAFGPDGFLYFTLGDGGGANDSLEDPNLPHGPDGNGQNTQTALGSILRIDVDSGAPFGIPVGNPFADGVDGLPEIYAYGMRNPYKFSFDDGPGGDGSLYLADVGQDIYEELNIVTVGGNYGWVIREGFHCFDAFTPDAPPQLCPDTGAVLGEPLLDPVLEYDHSVGIAIVGGFVYRGSQFPELVGKYVFGDFSTDFIIPGGRLFYADTTGANAFVLAEFYLRPNNDPLDLFVKGFGEDEDGELYVCVSELLAPTGASGVVLRITEPDPVPAVTGGIASRYLQIEPAPTSAVAASLRGPDPMAFRIECGGVTEWVKPLYRCEDGATPCEPATAAADCSGIGGESCDQLDYNDGGGIFVNIGVGRATCDNSYFLTPDQWTSGGANALYVAGLAVPPDSRPTVFAVTGDCASPTSSDAATPVAATWSFCDSSNDGQVTFFADLFKQFSNTAAAGGPGGTGPDPIIEVDTQGDSPDVPDQQVTFFSDIFQCFGATAAGGGALWTGETCP